MSCDRLVLPAGCVEAECTRLYAYEEAGRTYVGCLEKVFAVEVDLAMLEAAERDRGYGGVRLAREPLPVCRCAVDATFAHRADGPCHEPGFRLSAPPLDARTARQPA